MSVKVTTVLIVLVTVVSQWPRVNGNVLIENIHSGLKYAGKMFGFQATSDHIADLVSKAFTGNVFGGHKNGTTTANESVPANPFVAVLFRLMGLDGSKIGALSINGILLIAQMLAKTLAPSLVERQSYATGTESAAPKTKFNEDGTFPLDWILAREQNFDWVRDRQLPQNLVRMVAEFEAHHGEADCVKLLLCKSAPLVWAMQKGIGERLHGGGGGGGSRTVNVTGQPRLAILFRDMPDGMALAMHGDACELEFPDCNIYEEVPAT